MTEKREESLFLETTLNDITNRKEEDIQVIRELKAKENQWRKDRAVYEQKIELLEIQIRESKLREDNLKSMNENIMSALNDMSSDNKPFVNKAVKELQQAFEHHSTEILEQKLRTSEIIQSLDSENRRLKEKNMELEMKFKECDLAHEKDRLRLESKIKELEDEKRRYENEERKWKEERSNQRDSMIMELNNKLKEKGVLLEKLKEEQEKEIVRMQRESDQKISEIKKSFENEKQLLEVKVDKYQNALKKYQYESQNAKEISESVFQKSEALNKTIDDMRKSSQEEVMTLKKNKAENLKKIEQLESKLKNAKSEIQDLQEKLEEDGKLIEELQNKIKDLEEMEEINKKLNQKISELKNQIKKMESLEKTLKDVLIEKEDTSEERKKQITKLKKVVKALQEKNSSLIQNVSKMQSIDKNDNTEFSEMFQDQDSESSNFNELLDQDTEDQRPATHCSILAEEFPDNIMQSPESERRNLRKRLSNPRPSAPTNQAMRKNPSNETMESEPFENNSRILNVSKNNRTPISESKNISAMSATDIEIPIPYTEFVNRNVQKFKKKSVSPAPGQRSKHIISAGTPVNIIIQTDPASTFRSISGEQITDRVPYKMCQSTGGNGGGLQGSVSKYLNFHDNYEESLSQVLGKSNGNAVATALMCEVCKECYQPNEFLEHLSYCPQKQGVDNKRVGGSMSNLNNSLVNHSVTKPKLHPSFSSTKNSVSPSLGQIIPASMNSSTSSHSKTKSVHNPYGNNIGESSIRKKQSMDIKRAVEDLDYEKKAIVDRLREVEHRLKYSQHRNEALENEKENLRRNLENVATELKQTKLEYEITEGKKEECEIALKSEIKFLINKLLHAKGAPVDKSCTDISNNYANANSRVNASSSGFMNFYNQNKNNSSFSSRINQDSSYDPSYVNQSINNMSSLCRMNSNAESTRKVNPSYQNPNYNSLRRSRSHLRGSQNYNELPENNYVQQRQSQPGVYRSRTPLINNRPDEMDYYNVRGRDEVEIVECANEFSSSTQNDSLTDSIFNSSLYVKKTMRNLK